MASPMTPEERTLRARLAAHAQHAQGKTNTNAARQALQARFEREVDPDGVLSPEERAKRAWHARSAYYTRIALQASRARTAAAAAKREGRA